MKNRAFIALIGVFGLVSCSSTNYKTLVLKEAYASSPRSFLESKTDDYKSFKSGFDEFSNDIVSKFYTFNEEQDFIFSPTSFFNCFSLLTPLVNDAIKEDLLNVLHLDEDTLKNNFATYFDLMINTESDNFKELVANSIWMKNNLKFYEEALDTLASNFRTSSFSFDQNNTEALKSAIDSYIREKTNNLLNAKNMKFQSSLAAVLLSTLYIKDIWNEAGEELKSYKEKIDFKNHDGSTTNTEMLKSNYGSGKIYETSTFYKFCTKLQHGTKLSFIIPRDSYSISDILNEENIDDILHFSNYTTCDDSLMEMYFTNVVFPEFEAHQFYELKDFVSDDLKLYDLFDTHNTSIFSNLTKDALVVSDVIQENKLEVNKKGIEGASYTSISINETTSEPIADEYKNVYETLFIDREFVYVLEDSYDNVLFVGSLSNV